MRLALLVACGCGRIGFDPFGSMDAQPGDAIATCTTWSAWSTPQEIAELAFTQPQEPALSPDGQLLAFSYQATTSSTIYLSQRTGGMWGTPAPIAAVDTAGNNYGPAWAGTSFYFASDRSGSNAPYVSAVDAGTFGAPTAVAGLAVPAVAPTVSSDELEMFYTELYGATPVMSAIRRATRASTADPWTDDGRVTELSVTSFVGAPTLSADGLTLYFDENTLDGNIYVATRPQVGAAFSTPTPVSELNANGPNDENPELSRDGTMILFDSDRAVSTAIHLYVATRTCL